jgi:prolyl 4-hydroxylase
VRNCKELNALRSNRCFAHSAHIMDHNNVGATKFTKLDLAVKPKLGRALLWPSVLDSNPRDEDPKTYHEAQDVVKGIKFAANAWIHLHDYMAASDIGCT